jgi:predicted ribosomally synthesized peptide with SipW-like signal peptide
MSENTHRGKRGVPKVPAKLILPFAVAALLAGGAATTGGAYAAWNSSANAESGRLTAGTVKLDLANRSFFGQQVNLRPSSNYQYLETTLTNSGTTRIRYTPSFDTTDINSRYLQPSVYSCPTGVYRQDSSCKQNPNRSSFEIDPGETRNLLFAFVLSADTPLSESGKTYYAYANIKTEAVPS